ncbi:MAG TPA: SOS response-associated peptidase family protein [Bacteroidia bacterium]|nr:SOS response-associated peptidase family protein [Bacteroidia bacterium]
MQAGFYEWHTIGKKKYPYYTSLKEQPFFSMGCLYENCVNRETGEMKSTFSIITVAANPMMEKIHNSKKRMPFILPAEKEKLLIEKELPKEKIQQLMIPFVEDKMQAHTISKLITDRTRNSNVEEVMEKQAYPELA